jgi:hypothetical protein
MDPTHGTVFVIFAPMATSMSPQRSLTNDPTADSLPLFVVANHTDAVVSFSQQSVSSEVGPPTVVAPGASAVLAWDEPSAAVRSGRFVHAPRSSCNCARV